MFNSEIEDFKIEILELKKDNTKLKKENDELKVKIRKLQQQISKKHKIIDELIEPSAAGLRRDVSEYGPSVIMILKEENMRLIDDLAKKGSTIKKLQHDLEASKIYAARYGKSRIKISKSLLRKDMLCSRPSSTLSETICKSPSTSNIRSHSEDRSHRESSANRIISKNLSSCDITQNSREILDIKTLSNDKREMGTEEPQQHEELLELQNYFKDIISEVKTLKESIHMIRQEQEKLSAIQIEDGDGENNTGYSVSIEKLSDELKNLKSISSKIPCKIKSELSPLKDCDQWSSSSCDDTYGMVPKTKREYKDKKKQYKSANTLKSGEQKMQRTIAEDGDDKVDSKTTLVQR